LLFSLASAGVAAVGAAAAQNQEKQRQEEEIVVRTAAGRCARRVVAWACACAGHAVAVGSTGIAQHADQQKEAPKHIAVGVAAGRSKEIHSGYPSFYGL
jgi:hypothetical protein